MRTIVVSHPSEARWRAVYADDMEHPAHGRCEADAVGRLFGPCRQWISGDTGLILGGMACCRGNWILAHQAECGVKIERQPC